MAGGLTVSVRQVASYPLAATAPQDLVLLQQAGLGGPYISSTAYELVTGALTTGGSLGVGVPVPVNARGDQVFTGASVFGLDGAVAWNAYVNGTWSYLASGLASLLTFNPQDGFALQIAPPGLAGVPLAVPWDNLFTVSPAGAARLQHGTLTVARDPASAFEVATMGWVGAATVASFNGRRGVVTLSAADIGCALGYPAECIATLPQVDAAICRAIQDLIHTYPAVWSWNGRVGDVWLTLADINNVLATAGAPIIVPTPPTDANDGEAVNAGWVINYVTTLLAGPPTYATQDWVTGVVNNALSQTVSAFNGRRGAVFLTLADVTGAGGAPLASPSFSGIPAAPTANAGNSSSQIATTAFVMNAVTAATTGVISWQGRTGAVDMVLSDITSVGGAPVASPNFTGTPAAPTAAQGTSSSQIATTAFVMNEITASTGGVVSFNGRSGVVTLLTADITAAGGAPATSPTLTGVPTAPTAANGTNTQQLATTAFVMNEIAAVSAGVTTWNGRSGAVTLTANDITAAGGLANPSPALTGTGSTYPTSVTTSPTDSSTNIATTAFVQAAIANIGGSYLPLTGGANMSGQFNLSGNATANLNPVPLQQLVSTLTAYAPLASPAFSGTPTVPTATAGTATTQAASTAFVQAALGSYLPLIGGTVANLTVSGTTTLGATTVNGNLTTHGTTTLNTPTVLMGGTTTPVSGQVGQTITANVPEHTTGISNGTFFNIVTLSIPPGVWLVGGSFSLITSGSFTLANAYLAFPASTPISILYRMQTAGTSTIGAYNATILPQVVVTTTTQTAAIAVMGNGATPDLFGGGYLQAVRIA